MNSKGNTMATMDGKHMTTDQVRSTEEAFSTARALDLALEALIDLTNEMIDQDFVNQGMDAITAIKQARSVPAVPDVMTTAEGEHPEYVQGWNDCRQLMLQTRNNRHD
jgi:hypothetical protein